MFTLWIQMQISSVYNAQVCLHLSYDKYWLQLLCLNALWSCFLNQLIVESTAAWRASHVSLLKKKKKSCDTLKKLFIGACQMQKHQISGAYDRLQP